MTPHVVHVVGTLQAGGVQKLVIGLAEAAELSNVRQSVICLFGTYGELRDEFTGAGLDVHECDLTWPKQLPLPSYRLARWIRVRLDFTFPWRLRRLLHQLDATLVHTHVSHRVDLQTAGVLKRAKLPLVWTVHGLYVPNAEQRDEWKRAVALTRRSPARITADSGPVRRNLVDRGLAQLDEVQVVHAGADVRRFSVTAARDPRWRQRLDIPADALVYGTSGRLVDAKAHDVLVDAWKLLLQAVPNAHLVIAGSGPLQTALDAQITRNDLRGRVHLLGFQADIPSLLRELDVFVLSSRTEGFPLALIEALAAGLPCVATSVGGVDEMLGPTGGEIVAPDDAEALASAMARMADRTVRTRYASGSRTIANHFSYAACASEFSAIYRTLLPSWR